MKSCNDVKLDEELGINQIIEGFLQLRNKISVFDNDVIKFLIIHIHLNISFKFADKDYWEADEECAEVYEIFLKIFIQPLLEHFKLISDHRIQWIMFWFCLRYKINGMILWSVWKQGVSLIAAEHIQKFIISS